MSESFEKEFKHFEKESSREYHRILKNPWAIATLILGVVLIVGIILMYTGKIGGTSSASTGDVEKSILKFAKDRGIENVSVKSVVLAKDLPLYEVTLTINGQETPIYTTMDGKYLVASPDVFLPLSGEVPTTPTTPEKPTTPTVVPKTAKPVAELFVMTQCPYGTQAEKGMIPAIKALGTKADVKIRFVHYFMHGAVEEAETYNQLCIREEQPTKFIAYLECFLGTDGKTAGPATCLTKAGIDQAKLTKCLSTNKSGEYYAADSALSNKYGVQGSPSLIINGAESNAGRNPQSYLDGVCAAFTTSPTECTKKIDSANPSPGFGYAASTGAATAASCG